MLGEEIHQNGIKAVIKTVITGMITAVQESWQENVVNGDSQSRGETAGRAVIAAADIVFGAKGIQEGISAIKAAKAAKKMKAATATGKAAKEIAEEAGSAVKKAAENGIDAIDDVGKGALKSVDEVIEGGLDALSTPSSKVLRKNMIDAGIEVPDYPNAAHHIVAGNSSKATEARAILQKYGVDINDAANGTFLPTAKDIAEAAYHPSLHTNAYYDKINKLLSKATCKEDVLDILEFIGDELNSGTFMQ